MKTIQQLAREFGAADVTPRRQEDGTLIWPADPERVSVDRIAFHPDGVWSGWTGNPAPVWESVGYLPARFCDTIDTSEAEKRAVLKVPETDTDERCPTCSDDVSGQGGWCATCDG